MALGVLVVLGKDKKNLQVRFTNSKGKEVSLSPKEVEFSASIANQKQNAIASLDGMEVEFDIAPNGQPVKVRERGKDWESPATNVTPAKANDRGRKNTRSFQQSQQRIDPLPEPEGEFHNPYNFVPAPPRKTDHSELGDHEPAGHGCYHSNHWSGKIAVTLTTMTPLLIPDAANHTENTQSKHKTFPLRLGVDGKPYLPPTSIKGMLRSAYEAVTNSRFSIFEKKHGDRLAYRMATTTGLQMVPARIERNNEGNLVVQLYTGTSDINDDGTPSDSLYAAWLPRYSGQARNYVRGGTPQHGDEVEAWIEKFQHYRWDKYGKRHVPDFTYWRVHKIVPIGELLGSPPRPTSDPGQRREQSYHKPLGHSLIKIHGFVCITNRNIDRKHDERVFFNIESPLEVEVNGDTLQRQWRELIQNYQEVPDERNRGGTGPSSLRNSVWSRHITAGESERNLSPGTLCYAHVEYKDEYKDDQPIIKGLYPVSISRGLHKVSPETLLDQELKPAEKMSELSPADRVFGWVNQKGKGSYKGNLRIGGVKCETDDWEQPLGDEGLPLAILGQPKPQQSRFYVAKDKNGTPLNQGTSKEEGYRSDRGLRGRKVYPHHRNLPSGYWDNPNVDRTQTERNGHFQEYRRPKLNGAEQRDDQNRSIQSWVKAGVSFRFTIDLTNLSDVELGALLLLLSLPNEHYHRLGGGKSLGFGSARLEIDWEKTDLRQGKTWSEFYSSLDAVASPNQEDAEATIAIFKQAIEQVYGGSKSFDQIPMIQAFYRCAKGYEDGKPIHYPRARQGGQPSEAPVPPHPEGKAFEWFVANERIGQGEGPKVSLPPLWNDQGLPILNARSQSQR